jgi:glycosyltransferase involved in cell wall biosynthesis
VKPLHVLVATPLGRGGQGGIDRMMDVVANELVRSGRSDVRVYFAPTRGKGSIALAPFVFATFLARMLALRLLGRCDVVHANLASRGSTWRKAIIADVARRLGVPYVLHLHGALYREFVTQASERQRRRIRRLFGGASRVVVLGDAWRSFVVKETLVTPDAIVVMRNAVPAIDHGLTSDDFKRILFLGVLGKRKGTPELVEALARLPRGGRWIASIAGNGDIAPTRVALEDLELTDRVELPGWVDAEEATSLLSRSDILVLPSFAENLPMSVVEGMAAGLAIVTTPVGATPEIIVNGETGLLVPPGDVDALARALRLLLEDDRLRHRLGANARAFHRRHLEIGVYVDRLARLWGEAASG